MRLKTFSAPNMAEAMGLVRSELGHEAVIVSTRDGLGGGEVAVTAAVEPDGGARRWDEAPETAAEDDPLDVIDDALDYHRVPPPIADSLRAAAKVFETGNAVSRLAGALDSRLGFAPFDPASLTRPVLLMGPPGSGKTVTAAKIGAAAILARRKVRFVNTDVDRAGTPERLSALAERLEAPVAPAPDPEALHRLTEAREDEVVIIDTAGVNPFDDSELDGFTAVANPERVDPILVLPAGQDSCEAAEQAIAFGALGARQLLFSRIDAATRCGSILAAAHAARLPLAAAGIRPHIGDGLVPLNPMSLARLFAVQSGPPRDIMQPEPEDR